MIRFLRRFDPRSIRLLIFDLDGTLMDSRLDLIHSINAMLRHFGRPELDGDVIASYVGDGAPALVQRALVADGDGGDEAFCRSALEYFLGYYRLHKLDHTTVYDGIPETLTALAAGSPPAGAGGGVRPTRRWRCCRTSRWGLRGTIVQALGMGDFFVRIYGGNSFATKKPDPLGVRTLLEETGVAAEEALMIGDSSIDVLTGRNAGIVDLRRDLWICSTVAGGSRAGCGGGWAAGVGGVAGGLGRLPERLTGVYLALTLKSDGSAINSRSGSFCPPRH